MILALMVIYVFALHLIFNVFKWVTPTTRNRIYVTVIGLFGIYCILLVINIFQPMSTDLRVFRYVVPISPVVSGQVTDVPIEANKPIAKDDILFQIDPRPYRYKLQQIEAALAAAEQDVPQLKAAWDAATAATANAMASRNLAKTEYEIAAKTQRSDAGAISKLEVEKARETLNEVEAALTLAQAQERQAQLAYESEIGGVNTKVAQLQAQLEAAKYDLDQTTVRAPANGRVSDIALRPGQVVASGGPVMTFVNADSYVLAATFRQEVINRINPSDEAEIALDTLPGRTLAASVSHVDRDIPQGQVVPSGQMVDTTRTSHGFVFVHLELEDDKGLDLAAGEAGAATIFTDRGQAWIPVRKVFFRWYTWLNFIITEMDIRGKRQE